MGVEIKIHWQKWRDTRSNQKKMGYAILQKMQPLRGVCIPNPNNVLPGLGNKFTGMFAFSLGLVRLLHIPGFSGVLCFRIQ